jgi:transposase
MSSKVTPEEKRRIVELWEGGIHSSQEIAKRLNRDWSTVRNHLRKSNPKGYNVHHRRFDPETEERICRLYDNGMSTPQLQEQFGCSNSVIFGLLKRHGIKSRPYVGKHCANWKGGKVATTGGYSLIAIDKTDPLFCMVKRGRYVLEHRYVMAQYLGRPLYEWETVHHKSGDRADNRIENLQLCIGRHGAGQSYRCADCGSRNIVPVDLC